MILFNVLYVIRYVYDLSSTLSFEFLFHCFCIFTQELHKNIFSTIYFYTQFMKIKYNGRKKVEPNFRTYFISISFEKRLYFRQLAKKSFAEQIFIYLYIRSVINKYYFAILCIMPVPINWSYCCHCLYQG